MSFIVSPTQDDTLTVLKALLGTIVLDDTEIFQSQENRVPEPVVDNYIMMTPRGRHRLSTNRDSFLDCAFAASILNNQLTVTAIPIGKIVPPAQIFSPSFDLNVPVFIQSQISGMPGGIGVYQLSVAPDVAPSSNIGQFVIGQSPIEGTKFASGAAAMLQPTDFVVQLDIHGPLSADNAQTIATVLWDEIAWSFFQSRNPNIAPLYCDDPQQLPFWNDQQQIENRWVISVHIQVNATVTAPQQFADRVKVGLINVDAEYPP